MRLSTNFLLENKDVILLPFDKKQRGTFNYVEFSDKDLLTDDEAFIYKQKNNSMEIAFKKDSPGAIKELKLTNQSILTWDDLWIDDSDTYSIDPQIEHINLQRNSLIYANFNLRRDSLKVLNLEGNYNLKSFIATNLSSLEILDLSECVNLEVINLGVSKNIKVLSLKNCRLTEKALEKALSSFTPKVAATANIMPGTLPPFRKNYETLLDLRGNDINWGNRRIASKIRLLVTNNWLVLWDNPPPTSIIPIQMYAFFPRSIKETEIYQYYGRPSI